jgi:predicted dehydrogenase
MKRAVEDGYLGRPLLGEVAGRFWRDQAYYDSGAWRGTWDGEGGGSLMSQTSHTLDLMLWLLGPVTSVAAQLTRTPLHDIETEDLVAATIRFDNGAIGTLLSTTAAREPRQRTLAITGENGYLELVGDDLARFDVPALAQEAEQLRDAGSLERGDTTRVAGFTDSELHRRQIEDFVVAAGAGRQPLVDGVEGRKTLEVMRAIYRSAHRTEVVELPLGPDPAPIWSGN